MSNRRENLDRQMGLEDIAADFAADYQEPEILEDGACDIRPQLRGIMNEIIRESKRSREEIADEMTRLVLAKISVAQINSWTREARPRYIPLEYIFAFEKATGSMGITEYLCKLHQGKFIDKRDGDILDLGFLQIRRQKLAAQAREIKKKLKP